MSSDEAAAAAAVEAAVAASKASCFGAAAPGVGGTTWEGRECWPTESVSIEALSEPGGGSCGRGVFPWSSAVETGDKAAEDPFGVANELALAWLSESAGTGGIALLPLAVAFVVPVCWVSVVEEESDLPFAIVGFGGGLPPDGPPCVFPFFPPAISSPLMNCVGSFVLNWYTSLELSLSRWSYVTSWKNFCASSARPSKSARFRSVVLMIAQSVVTASRPSNVSLYISVFFARWESGMRAWKAEATSERRAG